VLTIEIGKKSSKTGGFFTIDSSILAVISEEMVSKSMKKVKI
jgi:hypothetical protein